jgi:tetratricopeptide (TPR) repeat protein
VSAETADAGAAVELTRLEGIELALQKGGARTVARPTYDERVPQSAAKEWQKALTLQQQGRLEDAQKILDPLIRSNPKYRSALFLKSNVLLQLGHLEESYRAASESVAASPVPFMMALERKMFLGAHLRRWSEVSETAASITKVNPLYAPAYLLHAAATATLGDREQAAKAARVALSFNRDDAVARSLAGDTPSAEGTQAACVAIRGGPRQLPQFIIQSTCAAQ